MPQHPIPQSTIDQITSEGLAGVPTRLTMLRTGCCAKTLSRYRKSAGIAPPSREPKLTNYLGLYVDAATLTAIQTKFPRGEVSTYIRSLITRDLGLT